MLQTNSNKLKVAVIGLGNIGATVAANLVKGQRTVIIADRSLEKAKALSAKLGSTAQPGDTAAGIAQPLEVKAALQQADIILLAIWFDAIRDFLKTHAVALQGKIIIDPSNPIAPDDKGGFVKIIDQQQSAGNIISALLPKDAKLVKAFGSLSAGSLGNAAHQQPEPVVLFYATDDTGINASVEDLIRDSGFAPVRIGGIDQSIRIEVFGDLHEFGALGKTVTLSEAKEKV